MKRKVGNIGYQIEFEDLDFKRYIRTSDNIFDLQSYRFFIIGKCEDDLRKPEELNVENRFFIHTRNSSQADTVEELCDEFRGVWKNYYESEKKDAHEEYHYDKEKNVFYNDFEELTHEEAVEKFDMFYGAIWTDEGLIYKVKLKGVLPNGEIDWEY